MAKRKMAEISRLVPCSVAILTVATKEKQDAMTASTMFVSENPPILTVSVAKHIVSHDLIEEAGEFVLNLATEKQVKMAVQVGFTHGKEVDKFKKFNIQKEEWDKILKVMVDKPHANISAEELDRIQKWNDFMKSTISPRP